jgi:hypothetical protein
VLIRHLGLFLGTKNLVLRFGEHMPLLVSSSLIQASFFWEGHKTILFLKKTFFFFLGSCVLNKKKASEREREGERERE